MIVFRIIYKAIKFFYYAIVPSYSKFITLIKFKVYKVNFGKFNSNGVPYLQVDGKFNIGDKLEMNNGRHFNVIGRQQKCIFVVKKNAVLNIGENVGISSTAIVCYNKITLGSNIKIGGNVVIYDTDFHSLNHIDRNAYPEVYSTKTSPVVIEDGVFIGAHSIILKGVTIGKNSIIGAGSVVAKSIPANQIWAGNPAKFIKEYE